VIEVAEFEDPAIAELNEVISISRIFLRVRDLNDRYFLGVQFFEKVHDFLR
jgi:hypothetical protein